LQGDVVGLLDSANTLVVEYKYDAWGELLSTTRALAATLGVENPFRYRGYVYDGETGYYYLRSRYYDPGMRRFICGDDRVECKIMGINSYCYCNNLPTAFTDANGTSSSSDMPEVFDIPKIPRSLSYVIESYERTFGLFGSFYEKYTKTISVVPVADIEGFIFKKWMAENTVNTVPVEEALNVGIDILLDVLPDPVPGTGIVLGIPSSIKNMINANEDAKLAQCIIKAQKNNTGIVIISEYYINSGSLKYDPYSGTSYSNSYSQTVNIYYEYNEYLETIGK
jgi:RHS repeat-associated protein